jgi:hypothetical protein
MPLPPARQHDTPVTNIDAIEAMLPTPDDILFTRRPMPLVAVDVFSPPVSTLRRRDASHVLLDYAILALITPPVADGLTQRR